MQALLDTIAQTPIADTHEHLITATEYAALAPDIINGLFGMHSYLLYEFVSAGCTYADIEAFLDQTDPDIVARWDRIAPYWRACRFTGPGEAVSLAAHALYGISELSGAALAEAATTHDRLLGTAGYSAILAQANLSDIQVDAFTWSPPDTTHAPLLRHDLNVESIASGSVSIATLAAHLGLPITDIATYRHALQALVARHAHECVAIKTQHAYARSLAWVPVDDETAAVALARTLAGHPLTPHEATVLGDWGLAVISGTAAVHGLPVKIHTGHHAGNNTMHLEWLSPRLLTPLLRAFPTTHFVVMHIGYPYHDEVLSLAKHYRNVAVDLCWAWCLDPVATSQFVRAWIHTVPINKLYGFGGDAFLPAQTLGYALQMRQWLTRALRAEVESGALSVAAACQVATAILSENQNSAFAARSTGAAHA